MRLMLRTRSRTRSSTRSSSRAGARSPARLAVLLAALAAAAPTRARADDPVPGVASDAVAPTADEWLRTGLERYERGNLVGAIDAFEQGHSREPRPIFLFAMAQAHRKRGDCDRARALYDAFLATAPPEAQADAARDQRERCEPLAPAPAVIVPPPAATPTAAGAPAPRRRGWWTDPIAVGAGGVGVGALGASVGLWLAAGRAADGATAATTYARHAQLRERADARQLQAGIALGVGVAAGAVTIWRLTRDRTERPRRDVAALPVLTPQTVGVALEGRF